MKVWDKMTEKFRRKQQEKEILETIRARNVHPMKGRPQNGSGRPTTHSKRLKARRQASRR